MIIVSTFKQQLLQKIQSKLKDKEVERQTPVWEAFQMVLEDLDFRVPIMEVTYDGKVYKLVLFDGGLGINILLALAYLNRRI